MVGTLFTKNGCENCDIVKDVLEKANYEVKYTKVKSLWDVVKAFPNLEEYEFDSFPILVEDDWAGDYIRIMERFDEPILSKTMSRFSLYPVKYNDLFQMYKNASRSFWQPEEVDLSKDEADWKKLTDDEKHFISYILSFFAGADGIVNENLSLNFASEVTIPEARAFYAIQEGIEAIHGDMYGVLLEKYITDPEERTKLQDGIETISAIRRKAEWALKWTNPKNSFAMRLVAFACVEGIFFSGSFCAIFWLKKRSLLPGLSFSNEFE